MMVKLYFWPYNIWKILSKIFNGLDLLHKTIASFQLNSYKISHVILDQRKLFCSLFFFLSNCQPLILPMMLFVITCITYLLRYQLHVYYIPINLTL